MTNSALQEMFDTFGKRICGIALNNNKLLLVDYRGKGSTKFEDISFETIGGCDMIVVQKTDISSGREVKYKNYIMTEFVESVMVMDEADALYRVDPMIMK